MSDEIKEQSQAQIQMEKDAKRVGVIGHVDYGKATLTAAITKYFGGVDNHGRASATQHPTETE